MNAEIISVGTELLLGETINTDAADVARLLSEFGINVFWQTVVGDNPGRLEQIVRRAKERSDMIITTGGLGPTCDDLTKETVAAAFGKKLVLNKEEEARLREAELFEGLTRKRVQAIALKRREKRLALSDDALGAPVGIPTHGHAASDCHHNYEVAIADGPERVAEGRVDARRNALQVRAGNLSVSHELEDDVGVIERHGAEGELRTQGLLVGKCVTKDVVEYRRARPSTFSGKSKLVDEDAGQRSSEVDQLQVMVTDRTVLLEQVESTHLHVVVRDDRGYPPLAEALVLADDGVAGVADIIEDALGLHLGIYLFGDVALIDLLKYVGTLLGKRTRAREQAAV